MWASFTHMCLACPPRQGCCKFNPRACWVPSSIITLHAPTRPLRSPTFLPCLLCLLCLQAMLVTSDGLLISEVRALEAEEGATDVDTLLFQLAASEEYAAAGTGQQGRERTPEDLQGGCTSKAAACAGACCVSQRCVAF